MRGVSCVVCARRRAGRRKAGSRTSKSGASKPSRSSAPVLGRSASVSREDACDCVLNGLGSGLWVGGIANRPPDHDVVGSIGERILDAYHTLLIVDRTVLDRSDSRRDDEQPLVELLAQHFRFEARGHDAIATGFKCAAGAREDQLLHIAAEPEILEIATIEAREHGDGEYLHVPFRFGG